MDKYENWPCSYFGQGAVDNVLKTPLSNKPNGETFPSAFGITWHGTPVSIPLKHNDTCGMVLSASIELTCKHSCPPKVVFKGDYVTRIIGNNVPA